MTRRPSQSGGGGFFAYKKRPPHLWYGGRRDRQASHVLNRCCREVPPGIPTTPTINDSDGLQQERRASIASRTSKPELFSGADGRSSLRWAGGPDHGKASESFYVVVPLFARYCGRVKLPPKGFDFVDVLAAIALLGNIGFVGYILWATFSCPAGMIVPRSFPWVGYCAPVGVFVWSADRYPLDLCARLPPCAP